MSKSFSISAPILAVLGVTYFAAYTESQGQHIPITDVSMTGPVIMFCLAYAYFYPSIMAFRIDGQFKWAVFLLNALFGWTILVWLVCLASCSNPRRHPIINIFERF